MLPLTHAMKDSHLMGLWLGHVEGMECGLVRHLYAKVS